MIQHNYFQIRNLFTFEVQLGSSFLPGPQGDELKRERTWAVDSKLRLRGRSLLTRECAISIACKQFQQT